MYKLIKGTELTNKQKQLLKFRGMSNPNMGVMSFILFY